MDAGLAHAVGATDVLSLERPAYELEAQFGTAIRNGLSIRAFSLELGEKVREVLQSGQFPLVIGGDCSILLGCLYGADSLEAAVWCTSMVTATSSIPAITTRPVDLVRLPEWTSLWQRSR